MAYIGKQEIERYIGALISTAWPEPEPEVCPAKEGEYIYNEDRGSYKCPYCMKVFNWDVYDDRDLFDEEEDEDSGPMNEDETSLKVSIINKTLARDFDLRVDREDSIMKLIEKLEDIDNKLKFL